MSQITAHVLDTSIGKPASGIVIFLDRKIEKGWEMVSNGITNDDGRVTDLLPKNMILQSGEYRMTFQTESYFQIQKIEPFYPLAEVRFYIRDAAHYHIPLLMSPFGYTTYRGS